MTIISKASLLRPKPPKPPILTLLSPGHIDPIYRMFSAEKWLQKTSLEQSPGSTIIRQLPQIVAKLDGFGDVLSIDCFRPGQVGNGLGHLDDPVITAST